MHCRLLCDIPGLYPLDVSNNPLVVTSKTVYGHCQTSSGGQILPRLRTTALERGSSCAGWVGATGHIGNAAKVGGTWAKVPEPGQALTLGQAKTPL